MPKLCLRWTILWKATGVPAVASLLKAEEGALATH
jgi:hypothetical protein